MLSTPDEILKHLTDVENRSLWEFDLESATLVKDAINLKYSSTSEQVQIEYFFFENQCFISEKSTKHKRNSLNNLWVLEQIKNRPYYMRVTLYIENP